jgi:anti-sigma factor RsiW
MRCRTVQERLNAFLDSLLQPSERAEMDAHLEGCHKCQAALARLRRLSALLESIPAPPVPDGFSFRLMQRAHQRQAEPRPSRILTWRPVLFWREMPAATRVAAAAMLVLAIGLGALMGRDLSSGPKPAGIAAAEMNDVYALDYLSEAPDGSLADAYLTLASAANGGGR